MSRAPFASVDEIIEVLESLDGLASDDVVAALPHLLQTAERLDRLGPTDVELVAAGLVHDLASALDIRQPDHATAGAALVGPLLGPRVAELVGGHTDAKRYLVTVEPSYADGLSANTTFTLVGQGGSMTPAEVEAFERRRECAALVALRRADDAAKVPGATVRPPAEWRPLLEAVVGVSPTSRRRRPWALHRANARSAPSWSSRSPSIRWNRSSRHPRWPPLTGSTHPGSRPR